MSEETDTNGQILLSSSSTKVSHTVECIANHKWKDYDEIMTGRICVLTKTELSHLTTDPKNKKTFRYVLWKQEIKRCLYANSLNVSWKTIYFIWECPRLRCLYQRTDLIFAAECWAGLLFGEVEGENFSWNISLHGSTISSAPASAIEVLCEPRLWLSSNKQI